MIARRPASLRAWPIALALLAAPLAAQVDDLRELDPAGDEPADARSLERFRYQCSSDIVRRDVTLFGNGTVRLREGLWESQSLRLEELGPDDLERYLGRLAKVQRSRQFPEADRLGGGAAGSWVEHCTLDLRLPDLQPVHLAFGRLDVLPLELTQLVQIAEELASFTRPLRAPESLPRDYEPRPGDVLRNTEGKLYRVLGRTDDGAGVELESLVEPLRVFYRLADLRQVFVAIESRNRS